MIVIGSDLLAALIDGSHPELKMIFNPAGVILFAANAEHREQKAAGISYEDDGQGNALAAMLRPGKIEIRQHRAFNDARVLRMLRHLLAEPDLALLQGWTVIYQGRQLQG